MITILPLVRCAIRSMTSGRLFNLHHEVRGSLRKERRPDLSGARLGRHRFVRERVGAGDRPDLPSAGTGLGDMGARALPLRDVPRPPEGGTVALKASRRRKLPKSAFAYPRIRSYPIDTPKRARNALARAAQSKTKGSYSHVARAVRKRYGNKIASVGRKRGTVSRSGYKRKGRK
jgi:hypothetical protein